MATGSAPQVVEKIIYFDDERVRRIARLLAEESAQVRPVPSGWTVS